MQLGNKASTSFIFDQDLRKKWTQAVEQQTNSWDGPSRLWLCSIAKIFVKQYLNTVCRKLWQQEILANILLLSLKIVDVWQS